MPAAANEPAEVPTGMRGVYKRTTAASRTAGAVR